MKIHFAKHKQENWNSECKIIRKNQFGQSLCSSKTNFLGKIEILYQQKTRPAKHQGLKVVQSSNIKYHTLPPNQYRLVTAALSYCIEQHTQPSHIFHHPALQFSSTKRSMENNIMCKLVYSSTNKK